MERMPITRRGYDVLQKELSNLKTVERKKTIMAIEEARAHGDLSENAEYHAAKERQGFVEGRIRELEFKLGNAEVIDPADTPKDRAVFGCVVLLENMETGDDVEYQLVGPEESDIAAGRISVTSPLGRAIIGKQPGEDVFLDAPGGKRSYELIDIR